MPFGVKCVNPPEKKTQKILLKFWTERPLSEEEVITTKAIKRKIEVFC